MAKEERFLLSASGSTRATAYTFGNKSVRIGDRTHAVWLDAVAQVRGRTFDHTAGRWSETFDLFEGSDNHTNPSLTADAQGFLSIAYGPHAHGWNEGRFRYHRSAHPNRIDVWEPAENFGYAGTYACLTQLPDGRDTIVYRGGAYPYATLMQVRRALGNWEPAQALFRQEIAPQYTHYGSVSAVTPDGTLFVAAHFHNAGGPKEATGAPRLARSYGMAVLKSSDAGKHWTDLRGESVETPALYAERYAVPPAGSDRRVEGLALDADENPWLLSCNTGSSEPHAILAHWTGRTWRCLDLSTHLPPERNATGGSLTIDTRGFIHVALMAYDEAAFARDPLPAAWGHPSTEVFHLRLAPDLRDVRAAQVSPGDPGVPHWLPSLSRAGLHHPVERPLLLYTRGVKGVGCSPPDRTEVWGVWVE